MVKPSIAFFATVAACFQAVPHASGIQEEAELGADAAAALALEDPQCALSLRQLRGEVQSAEAVRNEASATEVISDAKEDQAPTYNYNWYVGGDDKAPPGVSQDVTQTQGANGQPVYNYNWHFNFGVDDTTVTKGTCQTFGCLPQFDMVHLHESCQCFPGCDKTPYGNVCCVDYRATCEKPAPTAWGMPAARRPSKTYDRRFFLFNNAFCTNGHGGRAMARPSWVLSEKQCRDKCRRDGRCQGFVIFGMNHFCTQLSWIDGTKCLEKKGYHSAMKNMNWRRGGQRTGQLGSPGYHPAPTYTGMPSYHPPAMPGLPGLPGLPGVPGVPSYWPWIR